MSQSDRTYSISELAREFAVTPRALRFYEDKGLLTPRRDGLNRVYSHRDRGRLQIILRGKRVGLSLIEIKEILDLYKVDQTVQAQTMLKSCKARVDALKQQREDVDDAIAMLGEYINEIEDFLQKPVASPAKAAERAFDAASKKQLEGAH